MSDKDTNHHFIAPLESLELMRKLATVALKSHRHNPSPVEIKLELAELPADRLMQIEEDLIRIINANS